MWSLRPRTLASGFIPPCLSTGAPCAPSGTEWLHEIKHDGIRVIARKQDQRIKLYSRPGNDLTPRFPLIVERLRGLRARSCIVDGEAVACGEDGIALFEREEGITSSSGERSQESLGRSQEESSLITIALNNPEMAAADLARSASQP